MNIQTVISVHSDQSPQNSLSKILIFQGYAGIIWSFASGKITKPSFDTVQMISSQNRTGHDNTEITQEYSFLFVIIKIVNQTHGK